MKRGNEWTADEDATLARLIREGLSASAVGKVIGRSRASICGRAHRKNLHFKSQEHRPAVRNAKPPIRFTIDEDKVIKEMAADGKSSSKIAQAIDRSKSSVIKRARGIGAILRGKNGPAKGAPKVKAVKQHLHAGNIAGKKESRQRDPGFRHTTPEILLQPLMVALVELQPNMCRFPCGDPLKEGFGFCGHPKEDGAYCFAHASLCYTAPEDRRRAA